MEFAELPEKYVPIWKRASVLLKQGRPGDHQHAIEIAKSLLDYKGNLVFDLDVLIPVALMHDIGHSAILPEDFKYVTGFEKLTNAKLVHMLAGAKIAKDILQTVGYDSKKSEEIVDIIRVHDAEQLKDIDLDRFYDTEHKRVFHDFDGMDRFTEERIRSFAKMCPDREKVLQEIKKTLFFHDEFRKVAEERMRKLEGDVNMLNLIVDRKNMNLYPWYFAEQCLTKGMEGICGMDMDRMFLEFKEGHVWMYADQAGYDRMGEALFKRIKDDRGYYKTVERNILRTGDELLAFCESLPEDLSVVTDRQLMALYTEYAEKTKTMRRWGWIPVLIDGAGKAFLTDYLQERLREFLTKKGMEKKAGKYYSTLSSSEEMSEVQQEEIARLRLLKGIAAEDKEAIRIIATEGTQDVLASLEREHPITMQGIRRHAKEFGWLTYAYIGPPMSESDVLAMMKDSLAQEKSVEEQLEGIPAHYAQVKAEKRAIIQEVGLPEDLAYLCEVSAFFMHLKDKRKGVYQKSYVMMDGVIEEMAKRLGMSMEEVRYLTEEELEEAILKGADYKDIAKERTLHCVAITTEGQTMVYQGAEADRKKAEESFVEQASAGTKEFKGSTAYAGKARGMVRIILVKEDIPKMREGDILVSSATNPDLLLAMKKAAAIVTDMGGITSHAAIVSRELRIPCVVGTRIATHVLKDGDIVEVDAERGIVKKIS